MGGEKDESLIEKTKDPLIACLNKLITRSVKLLAIMMVGVIWWALIDVIVHVIHQIWISETSPFKPEVLLTTLGEFLLVMIAIEVFLNIVFFLKKDAIHVPLVLSTALTAIARKVIVVDYSTTQPEIIFAAAALILSLGVTYWLLTCKSGSNTN